MIKGKYISLRLIKETDLSALYDRWHDVEARGHYYPLALIPEPLYKQEFAKNGFCSEDSQRMLIVDTKDNMLGIIHCYKAMSYSDCMEISYFLFDIKKRRKGYATEAVMLMINYLFGNRRLNRIQLCIPTGNKASIRVAEKAGFIQEGTLRGIFLLAGKDVDMHIYALLRTQWKKIF